MRPSFESAAGKPKLFFIELYQQNLAESIAYKLIVLRELLKRDVVVITSANLVGYLLRFLELSAQKLDTKFKLYLWVYPGRPRIPKDRKRILRDVIRFKSPIKEERLKLRIEELKFLPNKPLEFIPEFRVKAEEWREEKLVVLIENPKSPKHTKRIMEYLKWRGHCGIIMGDLSDEYDRLYLECFLKECLKKKEDQSLGNLLKKLEENLKPKQEEKDPSKEALPKDLPEKVLRFLMATDMYKGASGPFRFVVQEYLNSREREEEENICNVYICMEDDMVSKLLIESPETRLIMPRFYPCAIDPKRFIFETFLEVKKNLCYVYACFTRQSSRGAIKKLLLQPDKLLEKPFYKIKSEEIEEEEIKVDLSDLYEKLVVICHDGIMVKLKEDSLCPDDFICPISALKFGGNNKKKEGIVVPFYLKARPCNTEKEEGRTFVEIYGIKTQDGGNYWKEKFQEGYLRRLLGRKIGFSEECPLKAKGCPEKNDVMYMCLMIREAQPT